MGFNGFITKSGTRYYVSRARKEIVGGRYPNGLKFIDARLIIGTRGEIYLANGKVLYTSIIERYF